MSAAWDSAGPGSTAADSVVDLGAFARALDSPPPSPSGGRTLCGYPQLASEPRYAAGQIGHVARRLPLRERLPPFVDHLDLAKQIPSEVP